MKINNDSMSVGTGFSRIEDRGWWLDGEVATDYGFVTVYAQGDSNNFAYSRLDFIANGRLYMRTFDKRYTARGLAMKARQFAREIVESSAE